jgi:hypothetical protein
MQSLARQVRAYLHTLQRRGMLPHKGIRMSQYPWHLSYPYLGSAAQKSWSTKKHTVSTVHSPKLGSVCLQTNPHNMSELLRSLRVLAIALVPSSLVYSQTPEWLWAEQTTGENSALSGFTGVTVDGDGNTIVAGTFRGTIDLAGTPLSATGGDKDHDVVVAKFDPDGALLWARTGGGQFFDKGAQVACDAEGNIYVVGDHAEGASFNGLSIAGSAGAFLLKYSAEGIIQYATGMTTGGDNTYGYSVSVDGAGNCDVLGGGNAPGGGGTLFWKHFDQAGTETTGWLLPGGPQGPSGGLIGHILTHTDGSFVIQLTVNQEFDADPGAGVALIDQNFTPVGVLLKYDATGTFMWARSLPPTGESRLYDVAIAANGDVLVGGDVPFGTSTFAGLSVPEGGFIARLAPSGNGLWIAAIQQVGLISTNLEPRNVAVDAAGTILVSGPTEFTSSFGFPATIAGVIAPTNTSSFVVQCAANGSVQQVAFAEGTSNERPWIQDIGVNAAGEVAISGYFPGTANFGTHALTSTSPFELFVAKLEPGAVGIRETAMRTVGTYPNPCDRALSVEERIEALVITDASGRMVQQLGTVQRMIDTSALAAGHYTMRGLVADSPVVARFVVQR